MTRPKLTIMMGRLMRMILSESSKEFHYDLPERFAPALMDLGYVEIERWIEYMPNTICCCSRYKITEKGRDAYFKWCSKIGD